MYCYLVSKEVWYKHNFVMSQINKKIINQFMRHLRMMLQSGYVMYKHLGKVLFGWGAGTVVLQYDYENALQNKT